MVVDISFKQMKTSDKLKEYIIEKTSHLQKYFKGKIHVTWTLSIEKQFHVAHCHVIGSHMDLFGEHSSDAAFTESIDLAVDKIEKQLRKHKEIVKNHLHRS